MRMILLYILFVAFSCQPFFKSENLKTSESEKRLKTNDERQKVQSSKALAQSSHLEAQNPSQIFNFSDSQILHYETQIHIADSLYKNYLPQYNFEEVKKAVEFFDSIQLSTFFESEKPQSRGDAKTQSSSLFFNFSDSHILFLRAKAHYYHAVGLTERDDVVGACEHYLIALEIMESETENLKTPKSEKGRRVTRMQSHKDAKAQSDCDNDPETLRLYDSNPDYEKLRFLSLIYTRLGELFLSENYCDLAISKYRKALKYNLLLERNSSVANTYKCLGNSYQLYGMPDSALYYYNKSLETNSELPNRLDVEKCIAQILFDKGEKDSAYRLINNNLDKIENYSSKNSYYGVLGEMFYKDMIYDSAICYLGKSVASNNYYIKYMSSITLSAIYESLEDSERKAYYDNIALKLYGEESNKVVEKNKIQYLYEKYNERKLERGKIRNRNNILAVALTLFALVFLIFIVVLIIMWYRYKRRFMKFLDIIESNNDVINQISEDNDEKQSKILEYSRTIEENEKSIALLEQELKNKEMLLCDFSEQIEKTKAEINDIRQSLENKENNIISLKKEIKKIKHDSRKENNRINIESYYNADICQKILRRKEYDKNPLSEEELALLLQAADDNLGNILMRLNKRYPRLRKEDMYCICLLLLNVERNRLEYLLDRNRKTIWERIKRIRNIMNIGADEDLFLSIKDMLRK